MTKKQCWSCYYYNQAHERNMHFLNFINEWCDISKAHNKYLMTDKDCHYYKDDFK